MALTTDIRIFPQKEIFAVDMAEILDTAVPYSGIIQGCEITFNSAAGTLSIEIGRMLIRGRLCVITERGDLAAPAVTGSENVACHLVATCNLSSLNPFNIEIVTPGVYTEYQDQKAALDETTFNTQDGFDFIDLGTAMVNPSSGKIVTWTPSKQTNVKNAIERVTSNTGGTYLPSGTNIDNLTKEDGGWWAYERANVSGTFPMPDTYGTIGHIQGTSANMATQIIRSNTQPRADGSMQMRFKVDGVWSDWKRYINVESKNVAVSRLSNAYTTFDGIAFRKCGFLWLRGIVRLTAAIPANGGADIAAMAEWTAPNTVYVTVANPNHNGEALYVTVSYNGVVRIDNFTSTPITLGSLFVFTVMAPITNGSE